MRRTTSYFPVPFDPGRPARLGGPEPVVNGVVRAGDRTRQTPAANYGISDNGRLVYLTGRGFGSQSPLGTLIWVDRRGREELLGAQKLRDSAPRLSPDGTRVAVEARNPQSGVWIWEIRRGLLTQFTSPGRTACLVERQPATGMGIFSRGRSQ